MNKYFSPLSLWLNGKEGIETFLNNKDVEIKFEYGSFLSLDQHFYLHDVEKASSQSLAISWDRTNNYIKEALKLTQNKSILNKEEIKRITCKLGEPPVHCYPIYIVTVEDNMEERIVYIGKTSANKNRFLGGHKVALKLHDPKYNNKIKNVYFACIMFLTKNMNYLPLEWISPKEKALELLDSIESYLIFNIKPELNIQKIRKNYSKYKLYFHIQNFSNYSNFYNDKFI